MVEIFFTLLVGFLAWTHSFPNTTDPSLKNWVKEYQADALLYGLEVDTEDLRYIGPADLGDNLAGLGIPPHVLLSPEYITDKEVFYHEMTHALFACPGHIDDTRYSIMNKSVEIRTVTWREAVKQLFTEDLYTLHCRSKHD